MKAFLLPGVGCDSRVFGRLARALPWDVQYVEWPKPEPGETLRHFAMRIAPQIKDPKNTILIGYSFGGMVAAELSVLNPAATVIIASIKSSDERPAHLNFLKRWRMHRLVSAKTAATFKFWMGWALGYLNKTDKNVIRLMLKNMDVDFNNWAVDAVIKWDFARPKGRVVHIQGTEDRFFPVAKVHQCITIKNGTHFMVWKRGAEVGRVIVQQLADLV